MSVKEQVIQLIQTLPEDATFASILRTLWEEHDTKEALRRFDERGGVPNEDLTDDEWMATICRTWAGSLNDPRDDVYSADDGEPSNDAR
jgi:hypothetical protein